MEEEIKEESRVEESQPDETKETKEEFKEESNVKTELVFNDLKKYVDIKINEVLEKIKTPEIEDKKEVVEVEVW